MRIHGTDLLTQAARRRLLAAAGCEPVERLADAQVAFGRPEPADCGGLDWLCWNDFDLPAAPPGCVATTITAAVAVQVAERVLSHLLVSGVEGRTMAGGRLGIFGHGAVGRELALRAKSLGAHVTVVRRRPVTSEADRVLTTDALDTLPACDRWVVATAHLSAADEDRLRAAPAAVLDLRREPGRPFAALPRLSPEADWIRAAAGDLFVTETLHRLADA